MSADLMKVSKGLKLVYWGLMVVVLAVILGVIGVLIAMAAGAAGQGGMGTLLIVVVGIAGVIGLVGRVLMLVGSFFCLSTPPKARTAKSRITLAVIFLACAALSSLAVNVISFVPQLPPLMTPITSGFSSIMQIAGVIFFLLFAKGLAEFVRRKQLADDAEGVLMLVYGILGCYVISLGVTVVLVALAVGAKDAGGIGIAGCFGALFGLAALVLMIMAVIKGARMLTELSDAVRVHAKKVRKKEREDEEEDDEEADEDEEEDEEEDEDDRPRRRRKRDEDDD